MHRMLFLLLVGAACGQLSRSNSRLFPFLDSIESPFDNDSDEVKFFRPTQNNFNVRNHFRDSDEKFFGGSRNNVNRFTLDDSNEFFKLKPSRNVFKNKNRFVDDSDEVPFFRAPTRINSNKISNNFNRNRFTSVEDIFEDLFDDDLDDRVRAQNALKKLTNTGTGNQFNRGSSFNRGFTTNFNTRLGSNRVNNFGTGTKDNRFINTNRITNPFASTGSSNSFISSTSGNTNGFGRRNNNNNGFSFGTNVGAANSHFGIPLPIKNNNLGSFSGQRSPTVKNTFLSSNKPKTDFNNPKPNSFTSSANTIRSNPFSNTKSSSSSIFPDRSGFNWPGGNGYYVRMSTGNSKPFSYFVKYDD